MTSITTTRPVEPDMSSPLPVEKATPAHLGKLKNDVAELAEQLGAVSPWNDDFFLSISSFVVSLPTADQLRELESKTGLQRAVIAQIGAFYDEALTLQWSESGERLVYLPKITTSLIFNDKPAVIKFGGNNLEFPRQFWVREQVGDAIATAAEALRRLGYELFVYDALRTPAQQEALFARRVAAVIEQKKKIGEPFTLDDAITVAKTASAAAPYVAGHTSGAAIDVGLVKDGQLVNMGYHYPEIPLTALPYPLTPDGLCLVPFEIFRARQMLGAALLMVGMNEFIGEHWHFSLGDVSAICSAQALVKQTASVVTYGPLQGFDPRDGRIEPYEGNHATTLYHLLNKDLMAQFESLMEV